MMNDPNFTVLWFVDKTNAYYERVMVRGFTSHYINDTSKRLTALASLRNNNSSIDCIAVRRPGKGSFCRFDTERVYLTVKGRNELLVIIMCINSLLISNTFNTHYYTSERNIIITKNFQHHIKSLSILGGHTIEGMPDILFC